MSEELEQAIQEQRDLFIWSQQGKMCIYLSIWGLLQHQNTSGENPYTPKTPWGENEFKLCLLNLMQALAEEAMSMQDIPLIPNREEGCGCPACSQVLSSKARKDMLLEKSEETLRKIAIQRAAKITKQFAEQEKQQRKIVRETNARDVAQIQQWLSNNKEQLKTMTDAIAEYKNRTKSLLTRLHKSTRKCKKRFQTINGKLDQLQQEGLEPKEEWKILWEKLRKIAQDHKNSLEKAETVQEKLIRLSPHLKALQKRTSDADQMDGTFDKLKIKLAQCVRGFHACFATSEFVLNKNQEKTVAQYTNVLGALRQSGVRARCMPAMKK